MNKPARFPRLEFSARPRKPRQGQPSKPVTLRSAPSSQERRELELQLRGARLTARERRRIEMQIEALA
jgi:hypothetical protein